ncbi:hypothetical protein CJ184_006575 [Actinotignum urinale]|uniref:hypothetical protein n=1 Tax=Actinotignum urinale TaxID=190146 RepID=UPI000C80C0EB|nr:hypothetical protein [Actinotignum urinale]WIK58900.1 hypothetical protein CJ184_006575 [Actinotignum urinale]
MLATLSFMALCYIIYNQMKPSEYIQAEDEIALKIQFDIKEDIGLIVLNYVLNGHEFSFGIENTDHYFIGDSAYGTGGLQRRVAVLNSGVLAGVTLVVGSVLVMPISMIASGDNSVVAGVDEYAK